jgi:hypothetical protein
MRSMPWVVPWKPAYLPSKPPGPNNQETLAQRLFEERFAFARWEHKSRVFAGDDEYGIAVQILDVDLPVGL